MCAYLFDRPNECHFPAAQNVLSQNKNRRILWPNSADGIFQPLFSSFPHFFVCANVFSPYPGDLFATFLRNDFFIQIPLGLCCK